MGPRLGLELAAGPQLASPAPRVIDASVPVASLHVRPPSSDTEMPAAFVTYASVRPDASSCPKLPDCPVPSPGSAKRCHVPSAYW